MDSKNRYTVLLPEDGEFGTEITKGNWSGLVGMLINQVSETSMIAYNSRETHLERKD